jgi:hypothetical protein
MCRVAFRREAGTAVREGACMTIKRMYVDTPDEWEEITEGEFLSRTEWAGYWKKGTALQALKGAGQIRTPFAFFRLAAAADEGSHDTEDTSLNEQVDRARAVKGGRG